MHLSVFDYDLPDGRIARDPYPVRDAARLLVDHGVDGGIEDRNVRDLPALLDPGDLVVINDTRVLPARLVLRRSSGGRAEALLLERDGRRLGWWEALVRPGGRIDPGEHLTVVGHEGHTLEVGEHLEGGGRLVRLRRHGRDGGGPFPDADAELATLHRIGVVPLPPYLGDLAVDPDRYQTVYARHGNAVAAPTAGLHLTVDLLERLRGNGIEVASVTLDVGRGTFQPMTADRVEDHRMHAERYQVPGATISAVNRTRARGGRVVAVGTTTLRALEAWRATGTATGRTELYICRPFAFSVVDRLLTNFHQPRSSLLVLIDAFIGDRWRTLYEYALSGGYRFLSFGDAMLLTRDPPP